MKKSGLIIILIILVLLVGCIESVFHRPLYKIISLQLEYLFSPKYSEVSGYGFWPNKERVGPMQLLALAWADDPWKGIVSPSGNIFITFSNRGAHIRSQHGVLLTEEQIPIDIHSFSIFFRSDEKEIIFTEIYGDTYIWTSSGNKVIKLEGWEALGYSPDERYIIANGEAGLAFLDHDQRWEPNTFVKYDQVRGFSFSQDQQYFLTYGCSDGMWWYSGFICFDGGSTLWDLDGNKIADFDGHDDVIFAGFTSDMKSIATKGCDGLWTWSRDFPIQNCFGTSTRYFDLQGNFKGLQVDRKQEIHLLGGW